MSQVLLTEAETALHILIIGKKPVSVTRNGRSITYQITDEKKLRQYITELKAGIDGNKSRRAIGVSF
jgi:hypothetical protein